MVQFRQKEYKIRKITPSMAVIDITTDFTVEDLMALSNKLAKDHMFSSSTIRMDLRLYTELIQKEDFDERIMYPSARFSGRLMEYNGCKIMEPGKDNVITIFNADWSNNPIEVIDTVTEAEINEARNPVASEITNLDDNGIITRVQVYDTVLGTWTTVRQNGGIID